MSDEMYYHTIPTDVIEPDEIKNVQFLNDNDSSDSDSNTITKANIEIKKKVVKNLMFIKPDEDDDD
jgi:hypothetical protein